MELSFNENFRLGDVMNLLCFLEPAFETPIPFLCAFPLSVFVFSNIYLQQFDKYCVWI
jgi:hypothetical protein